MHSSSVRASLVAAPVVVARAVKDWPLLGMLALILAVALGGIFVERHQRTAATSSLAIRNCDQIEKVKEQLRKEHTFNRAEAIAFLVEFDPGFDAESPRGKRLLRKAEEREDKIVALFARLECP